MAKQIIRTYEKEHVEHITVVDRYEFANGIEIPKGVSLEEYLTDDMLMGMATKIEKGIRNTDLFLTLREDGNSRNKSTTNEHVLEIFAEIDATNEEHQCCCNCNGAEDNYEDDMFGGSSCDYSMNICEENHEHFIDDCEPCCYEDDEN
jgi:hypothetical protein